MIRPSPSTVLSRHELAAARYLIARILDEIRAPLWQASLFGSKARRSARPDSDLDILLIFRDLPPSREPYAGQAEAVAEEVATETGVPVSVWSVALSDLEEGARTPMLVDAMEDALPVWAWTDPLPAISFTPADARTCVTSLLKRVEEGGAEFAAAIEAEDLVRAHTRARDDIIRLCTALLLTRGITRPRRSEAVAAVRNALLLGVVPRPVATALAWAEKAFGEDGKAEFATTTPPLGLASLAAVLDELRLRVCEERQRLSTR